MPLEKIVLENDRAWALWHIAEDEPSLSKRLEDGESVSPAISHVNKRLEWLAGRVLVAELFKQMSIPFHGIVKDPHGKPFPRGNSFHMSLSHSFPYVAAIVDKKGPVGIDLEQPKEKLLRIAHRIHSQEELHDAGDNLIKHCVYWCAKESLVKVHGKKDLIFSENLRVEPFVLRQGGDIRGRIIVSDTERVLPLRYIVFTSFVMVYNLQPDL